MRSLRIESSALLDFQRRDSLNLIYCWAIISGSTAHGRTTASGRITASIRITAHGRTTASSRTTASIRTTAHGRTTASIRATAHGTELDTRTIFFLDK